MINQCQRFIGTWTGKKLSVIVASFSMAHEQYGAGMLKHQMKPEITS